MNKGLFYLITLAIVALMLSAPTIAKVVTKQPACHTEIVEVTKTEGDLMWTDFEPMCVPNK